MTPNDKKIIKAFPEATPFQLLNDHGLSEAGYNELLAKIDSGEAGTVGQAQKPGNLLIPDVVKQHTGNRVTPQTQPLPARHIHKDSETVILVEKATDKRSVMAKFAAERWAKKHGMKYSIEQI